MRLRFRANAGACTFEAVGFQPNAGSRTLLAHGEAEIAGLNHAGELRDANPTGVGFHALNRGQPVAPCSRVTRSDGILGQRFPGLDGLGERLVRFFLETWDSPAGRPLLALVRSVVASEDAAALLRGFVTREVLGRLARALEVDQPQLRATLAASQPIGMAMLRYVIKLEPLASAPPEVVAGWLGPAVQRYFTDPAVTARRPRPTIGPMSPAVQVSLADQLNKIPAGVRPTVKAAIKLVKTVAPRAEDIAYRSQPPRSKSAMWKLVRYRVDGANVVGIGTFPNHSTLFFYRGRELDDGSGLLQGSGKDARFITLNSPGDVERPAVKRLVRNAFRLGGVGS